MVQVLNNFLNQLQIIFGDKLVSVILYGSVVLNDFTPGKGDIDFLAVLKDNINDNEINQLIRYHESLRDFKEGILGSQIEGSYYTQGMFLKQTNQRGYYIGTRRDGWKEIFETAINSFDQKNILDHGKIVYGKDIRYLIITPTNKELKDDLKREIKYRLKLLESFDDLSLIIDTIYLILRGISFFQLNQLVSKTKAVNNYLDLLINKEDEQFIRYVSQYRLPLIKAEEKVIDHKYMKTYSKTWLERVYKHYFN